MTASTPERPDAATMARQADDLRLRRVVRATGLGLGVFSFVVALGLGLSALGVVGESGVRACVVAGALLGWWLGASLNDVRADDRRLTLAQKLVQAGHGAEALPLLKELSRGSPSPGAQDTICYLTARAYELQGAVKLALAYYGDYRKRFSEGAWALEVKHQSAELRRLEKQRKALRVAELPAVELRCPYCHEDVELGKEGTDECSACGTRAHSDCTREHGGCAVFGCSKAQATHERA